MRSILTASLALLAGCATAPPSWHEGWGDGQNNLSVRGRLDITLDADQASIGIIDGAKGCTALALPDEVLRNAKAWNGRQVVASGRKFAFPQGPAFLWIEVYDRRITASPCRADANLFVLSLRAVD